MSCLSAHCNSHTPTIKNTTNSIFSIVVHGWLFMHQCVYIVSWNITLMTSYIEGVPFTTMSREVKPQWEEWMLSSGKETENIYSTFGFASINGENTLIPLSPTTPISPLSPLRPGSPSFPGKPWKKKQNSTPAQEEQKREDHPHRSRTGSPGTPGWPLSPCKEKIITVKLIRHWILTDFAINHDADLIMIIC